MSLELVLRGTGIRRLVRHSRLALALITKVFIGARCNGLGDLAAKQLRSH